MSVNSPSSKLAEGQVALGDFSPRAPTDPYVPALEHTGHPMLVAMQQRCIPGMLSWAVSGIRNSKFKASDVFPDPGSNIRHPLSVLPSLHRVLRDQFPGFISTMRVLRHPTAISPHFVSFAWRYLGCTRSFAPWRTSAAAKAWSW